jgi:KAP family P-loop domain
MLRRNPSILHFCGTTNEFVYETGDVISSEVFSDMLSISGQDIKCVILGSNNTKQLAQKISKYANSAISIGDNVTDRTFREFSISFYEAIGEGRNITESFELAKNKLKLLDLDDTQFTLYYREGISPETIELFPNSESKSQVLEEKIDSSMRTKGVASIPDDVLFPTYIETDIWTTHDKLNYEIYAIAIANFLTKPETKPPLSISIQAPWGGGKSSLMRMIQEQLDEKGASLAKERIDYKSTTNVKLKEIKWAMLMKLFEKFKFWKNKDLKKIDEIVIPNFDSKGYKIPPKVTIWFNAWKYESTEQVWAGLADSIVREISSRLKPVERGR